MLLSLYLVANGLVMMWLGWFFGDTFILLCIFLLLFILVDHTAFFFVDFFCVCFKCLVL